MRIVDIARVAHEANRAYCLTNGDESQAGWNETPDWQKESVILGVMNVIRDPDTTPEKSHEGWMAHKAAEGWVFGPVKDAAAKTHPCMRLYKDLPVEQRVKDHLFLAVVKSLVPSRNE